MERHFFAVLNTNTTVGDGVQVFMRTYPHRAKTRLGTCWNYSRSGAQAAARAHPHMGKPLAQTPHRCCFCVNCSVQILMQTLHLFSFARTTYFTLCTHCSIRVKKLCDTSIYSVIHKHDSWVMEHKQARARTRTRRNRRWENRGWEFAGISLGDPAVHHHTQTRQLGTEYRHPRGRARTWRNRSLRLRTSAVLCSIHSSYSSSDDGAF
jgi:hypothetical protein